MSNKLLVAKKLVGTKNLSEVIVGLTLNTESDKAHPSTTDRSVFQAGIG